MSWNTAYIIVRVAEDGSASVVHQADKIKDARYWLQYIALPGDAILQTPAHPKYSGDGSPLYQAHLFARGKINHDEKEWEKMALKGATKLNLAAPA